MSNTGKKRKPWRPITRVLSLPGRSARKLRSEIHQHFGQFQEAVDRVEIPEEAKKKVAELALQLAVSALESYAKSKGEEIGIEYSKKF